MKKTFFGLSFSIVSALMTASPAYAEATKTAVQALEEQGIEVVREFDTPMNLKGYVGNAGGQYLTFYATEDESHLIIGTMINANAENLSDQIVQNEVIGPKLKESWPQVENSQWVQDGLAESPKVMYTFTDPNCPYCVMFREKINPWIESNAIQLRHIMVGVITEDSIDKSAMILASDDSEELLHRQQSTMREGGISVDDQLVSEKYAAVKENNKLMSDLGFSGTPTTVFKDHNGDIRVIRGVINEAQIEAILSGDF